MSNNSVDNPMQPWTGASASRLQTALRLSTEDFARQLRVATRTVANWHAQPERVPRPEIQQLLDSLFEGATVGAKERFSAATAIAGSTPTGLHVAIAIVLRQQYVLLVQRRDGNLLSWQFPAGIVKPESSAARVAVLETKNETGIDCMISGELGSRLHPITGVFCVYYLCDYLAGEPTNLDVVENASVIWAPTADLSRFIPALNIYPPVLTALGVAA